MRQKTTGLVKIEDFFLNADLHGCQASLQLVSILIVAVVQCDRSLPASEQCKTTLENILQYIRNVQSPPVNTLATAATILGEARSKKVERVS
jgi:hypothetical protein